MNGAGWPSGAGPGGDQGGPTVGLRRACNFGAGFASGHGLSIANEVYVPGLGEHGDGLSRCEADEMKQEVFKKDGNASLSLDQDSGRGESGSCALFARGG